MKVCFNLSFNNSGATTCLNYKFYWVSIWCNRAAVKVCFNLSFHTGQGLKFSLRNHFIKLYSISRFITLEIYSSWNIELSFRVRTTLTFRIRTVRSWAHHRSISSQIECGSSQPTSDSFLQGGVKQPKSPWVTSIPTSRRKTPKLSVNKFTCLQFYNLLTYTFSENIELGVNWLKFCKASLKKSALAPLITEEKSWLRKIRHQLEAFV